MTADPEFTFWLGTHEVSWLARPDVAVPLFISHVRLRDRRSMPRAVAPWACDSGGFTELDRHGVDAFADGPAPYVAALRRYRDEIGSLAWAAPQDWMCEPSMLAKTGLTVAEHQRLTVDNYLRMRELAPELPVIPVLQGWDHEDYLRCADLYSAAGVDLPAEPLVGLGSVCRRNRTGTVRDIALSLGDCGLRLHVFGAKGAGAVRLASYAISADSLAWSYNARRKPALAGCRHKSCANCPRFALRWRERLLACLDAPRQLDLFGRTA